MCSAVSGATRVSSNHAPISSGNVAVSATRNHEFQRLASVKSRSTSNASVTAKNTPSPSQPCPEEPTPGKA
ncbi:MAG: hypothetical protein HC933_18030 [Pleurocapsa sp. SU_196_0]|nr:hypothetical protein [Pleurocapsa sp. SU_196_0]